MHFFKNKYPPMLKFSISLPILYPGINYFRLKQQGGVDMTGVSFNISPYVHKYEAVKLRKGQEVPKDKQSNLINGESSAASDKLFCAAGRSLHRCCHQSGKQRVRGASAPPIPYVTLCSRSLSASLPLPIRKTADEVHSVST